MKILLVILPLYLMAYQGNYTTGKDLYFQKGCANCHGTNAEGSGYYPKLANKPEKFIIKKLKNFKKGIASSQKQEIMFTFAKSLSEANMKDLALYLHQHSVDETDNYEISDDLLGSMD